MPPLRNDMRQKQSGARQPIIEKKRCTRMRRFRANNKCVAHVIASLSAKDPTMMQDCRASQTVQVNRKNQNKHNGSRPPKTRQATHWHVRTDFRYKTKTRTGAAERDSKQQHNFHRYRRKSNEESVLGAYSCSTEMSPCASLPLSSLSARRTA